MAQLQIPMDAKRFATGMTWKDYMAQMGDTRARTEENYERSRLTDDERKFFSGITGVKYVGFQGNGIVNDFLVEAAAIAP